MSTPLSPLKKFPKPGSPRNASGGGHGFLTLGHTRAACGRPDGPATVHGVPVPHRGEASTACPLRLPGLRVPPCSFPPGLFIQRPDPPPVEAPALGLTSPREAQWKQRRAAARAAQIPLFRGTGEPRRRGGTAECPIPPACAGRTGGTFASPCRPPTLFKKGPQSGAGRVAGCGAAWIPTSRWSGTWFCPGVSRGHGAPRLGQES